MEHSTAALVLQRKNSTSGCDDNNDRIMEELGTFFRQFFWVKLKFIIIIGKLRADTGEIKDDSERLEV